MQQQEEHNWVIVSKKPGRGLPYWRPNSAGYTDSVTDAGKYSYEEAARIVQGNHGDDEKYCLDDPALLSLIRNQNMVRGKELALWLEVAQLRAAPRPEALPPLQDAEVAEYNKTTECLSCGYSNLTVDFGAKCPECGSKECEQTFFAPTDVLENLLYRAKAAHAGPYSVEILGDRSRWFKTNNGSNILRKLLSEFELDALSVEAAQRLRATDAYMAVADPQTVAGLVREVLEARNAQAPRLLQRLRAAEARVPQWVPSVKGVSLPEKIGHYLCLCDDGAQMVCFLSVIGEWSVFPGAQYYGDLAGGGQPQPDRTVTHWQPLPSAPADEAR